MPAKRATSRAPRRRTVLRSSRACCRSRSCLVFPEPIVFFANRRGPPPVCASTRAVIGVGRPARVVVGLELFSVLACVMCLSFGLGVVAESSTGRATSPTGAMVWAMVADFCTWCDRCRAVSGSIPVRGAKANSPLASRVIPACGAVDCAFYPRRRSWRCIPALGEATVCAESRPGSATDHPRARGERGF